MCDGGEWSGDGIFVPMNGDFLCIIVQYRFTIKICIKIINFILLKSL